MSTDIQREARELLDGIMPGEWKWNSSEDRLQTELAAVLSGIRYDDGTAGVWVGEPDAEFIAAAPRVIRGLLAEIETLRGDGEEQA